MHKSYYAIIPANVRYDKKLQMGARLLYGEITALTNEKGYCWANNTYFSELYNVSIRTIQRWIKQLEECGYIFIELVLNSENEKVIESRNIYINRPHDKNVITPSDKNVMTQRQKCQEGSDKNVRGPHDKNVIYNNTPFNNTSNIKTNKKKDIKISSGQLETNDFQNIFLSFTNNQKLIQALNNFLEMRISKKSKPTIAAMKLILEDLELIAKTDDEKIMILNKSIKNNWNDVYSLKSDLKIIRKEDKPDWVDNQPEQQKEHTPEDLQKIQEMRELQNKILNAK